MDEKKYYWIKLKTSFLTSEKVDFLMSQPNGANYVVLYQCLCLRAVNTNGELFSQVGEIIIPYDIDKIKRDVKWFDIDTIRVALEIYKNLGLIYQQENGILKINDYDEIVGSETKWANIKRIQRYNKLDKVVDNVQQEYRYKSIDNKSIDNRVKNKEKNIIKKESVDDYINNYSDNDNLLNTLFAYKEMRIKIKKPLTAYAIKIILGKLDSLSNNDDELKIAILNQSIGNAWQGIFELKSQERYKYTQNEKICDNEPEMSRFDRGLTKEQLETKKKCLETLPF